MSKRRRSDAAAAVADLLARNPDLHIKDDGRGSRPAPYRLTEARDLPGQRQRPSTAPTEHEEQVALFAWAAANEGAHPELAMLHATPNGGYRPMTTAVMLKAEGVKAGVPDILLPIPRGQWHSLWLELKRADHSNGPTKEQQEWIKQLRHYGNMALVCYGADEAIAAIESYLAQP